MVYRCSRYYIADSRYRETSPCDHWLGRRTDIIMVKFETLCFSTSMKFVAIGLLVIPSVLSAVVPRYYNDQDYYVDQDQDYYDDRVMPYQGLKGLKRVKSLSSGLSSGLRWSLIEIT